jgi:predicted mannosyl-3-phosphoglycerate phosphatase (HAD superfamily)
MVIFFDIDDTLITHSVAMCAAAGLLYERGG